MTPWIRKLRQLLARPRLGIELESTGVRGVLVERGEITNAEVVGLADVESLDVALTRVLEALRRPAWRKPLVYVAIGPAASQLRRLNHLPAIDGTRLLRDMVHSNAGRFFLKNGVPLLTSSVRREEGGNGWAAAVEEPPVRAVAEACRSSHLRLELAAPSIVALRCSLEDEWLTAVDGEVVMRAHVGSNGAIREIRRLSLSGEAGNWRAAMPVAALRSLGDAAMLFAAAYGATTIDRREPLALHARDLRLCREVSVPRWRMLLAISSLCFATMLALTLPAFYAQQVATRTARRLESVNRQYRQARWMEAELERTTASLREIDEFEATRRSTIRFIADLTTALPQDAWLQSLHLDKEGGTLTALAPRAAVTAAGLASLRSISTPTIVGTVSAEQLGPDRVERVTMRFRWKQVARTPASSPATAGGGRQ